MRYILMITNKLQLTLINLEKDERENLSPKMIIKTKKAASNGNGAVKALPPSHGLQNHFTSVLF